MYFARFRIVDEQLVFVIAVCGEVGGLCRIGIVGTRNGGYGLPLTEGRRLRQAFAFAVTYFDVGERRIGDDYLKIGRIEPEVVHRQVGESGCCDAGFARTFGLCDVGHRKFYFVNAAGERGEEGSAEGEFAAVVVGLGVADAFGCGFRKQRAVAQHLDRFVVGLDGDARKRLYRGYCERNVVRVESDYRVDVESVALDRRLRAEDEGIFVDLSVLIDLYGDAQVTVRSLRILECQRIKIAAFGCRNDSGFRNATQLRARAVKAPTQVVNIFGQQVITRCVLGVFERRYRAVFSFRFGEGVDGADVSLESRIHFVQNRLIEDDFDADVGGWADYLFEDGLLGFDIDVQFAVITLVGEGRLALVPCFHFDTVGPCHQVEITRSFRSRLVFADQLLFSVFDLIDAHDTPIQSVVCVGTRAADIDAQAQGSHLFRGVAVDVALRAGCGQEGHACKQRNIFKNLFHHCFGLLLGNIEHDGLDVLSRSIRCGQFEVRVARSYGIEHRHKLRNVELQGFLSDDFVFGLKP